MREFVARFTGEYADAKQHYFAGHELGNYIRNTVPQRIYNTGLVDANKYLITGSVGQGGWAMVPWVCIFDRRITTTATKGVYIVYLLSKDGNTLYLTLNQGCTEISKSHGKKETIEIMRNKAEEIIAMVDRRGFACEQNISLGDGLTQLAEFYEKGIILYKAYKKGAIPEEDELRTDLNNMLGVYEEYVSKTLGQSDWWPSLQEYNPGITKEKWIELLNNSDVFTDSAKVMISEFYAFGGEATCAQLAERYKKTYNYYLMTSVHLAERIVKATGCPVMSAERNVQNAKWWPVLYVGRDAGKEEKGTFVWKIRQELSEALAEFGIDKYLPRVKAYDRIGKFDSWEIVDEVTAIKTCDKSFFDYNGSGVPQGIHWFFEAEELENGESKAVSLIYNGEKYSGKVSNDSTDRKRMRVFWNGELGAKFNVYKDSGIRVSFIRIEENTYELTVLGGEKEMTIKEQVAAIKSYIAARGFNYDGNLVENFYLSLKSKPFVILAGTSGTGKTRLVRLFAEAIGAEYNLVSVRPDWSDSSDLFGHVDLNQKFIKGDIIDFVKSAELNPTKPYILCLDEMNLARVEYYMSDILSTIETRRFENGQIITDAVISASIYGNDTAAAGRYGKVMLPGNLYIVGTVNMDETTFPFSKKVLDRANTIEFSYVNLLSMPSFEKTVVSSISVSNNFLVSEYITLNDCSYDDQEYIEGVCAKLQRINIILEKANAHVGYRVRDEIVFYMLNNKKTALLEENVAFDNQVMQKILPRIQGSSESIKDILGELLKVCESEKYEASTKKINFMIKRYEEDGFTSYWL